MNPPSTIRGIWTSATMMANLPCVFRLARLISIPIENISMINPRFENSSTTSWASSLSSAKLAMTIPAARNPTRAGIFALRMTMERNAANMIRVAIIEMSTDSSIVFACVLDATRIIFY